jgi:hypothetical protein
MEHPSDKNSGTSPKKKTEVMTSQATTVVETVYYTYFYPLYAVLLST